VARSCPGPVHQPYRTIQLISPQSLFHEARFLPNVLKADGPLSECPLAQRQLVEFGVSVMAFVTLSGGQSGNLDNYSIYDFGFFNDTVLIRDGNTTRYDIFTFEGNDVVYNTRTTAALNAFSFQQVFLGEGNDKFFGGGGVDASWDGSGNDFISLGAGSDIAHAAAGNDVIDGGSGFDEINFASTNRDGADGSANNLSGVIVDLLKTTAQNFGQFGLDTITGFENVIGSLGSDRILGTNGANEFQGFGGNDYYDARGGNDQIFAFGGSETIIGGGGADTVYVGESTARRDTLKYNAITESGITAATWDNINNFDTLSGANRDVIDLSTIDANAALAGNQAFIFRGTGAFSSAAGEVRLVIQGSDTFVWVDTDADAAAEMIIHVTNFNATALSGVNFIL
jgi:Ca2+-binding RTX toxin-like protein